MQVAQSLHEKNQVTQSLHEKMMIELLALDSAAPDALEAL
jgi:hypothetical protein